MEYDLGVRASSPIDAFERDASLGRFASFEIMNFPAPLACHVAVWYWAARRSVYESLWSSPSITDIALLIASMDRGPQNAMIGLRQSGQWDFDNADTILPPVGTVLLWEQSPTHSAVVTEHGITGYNQAVVFSPYITTAGHTHGQPNQVSARFRQCFTISEEEMMRAARSLTATLKPGRNPSPTR